MTFTIGKHRMRNGEEATVSFIGPDGTLFGYMSPGTPFYWGANGQMWSCNESQLDLLPPPPPKLEPIVDWVVRDKDGKVYIYGFASAENALKDAARLDREWPAFAPHTIHKRTTEQVED